MKLVGFSLDNLSLMALTISTGFVVDDAIVMIENIVRFIEAGEPPMQAALKGAKQIGFTIISLSVSLIAVFIPLIFMTGIVGRLFREFAITLSVAVVVSAIVSLTLTPMMCARLLQPEDKTKHGRLFQATERLFKGMLDAYDRSLQWVLRHQAFTLGVAVVTLVATIWLYVIVPKGLLPQQDTGLIIGVTDAAQSISFKAMVRRQRAIAEIVPQRPGRGERGVVCRRRHGEPDRQLRPPLHQPQAARPPQGQRRARSSTGCARPPRRPGHLPLHAGGPGRADRQPRQPHPVPIHAAGRRRGGAIRVGAANC